MSRVRRLLLAFTALAVLAPASPVVADEARVTVERAWSRATPPGMPVGVGYLTIHNPGAADDQLVAVSSPAAGEVQIHESQMVGDEARMRQHATLLVPAGGTLVLEPGGYHLMLMDLRAPLVVGQRVPVTLTFARSGAVTTELLVGRAGAPAPFPD